MAEMPLIKMAVQIEEAATKEFTEAAEEFDQAVQALGRATARYRRALDDIQYSFQVVSLRKEKPDAVV